jgi:hypothetical protein
MYLRRNRSGQGDYEYWTLVRSVPTAQGPRQAIVATLGKLPGLDEEVRAGLEKIHEDRLYRGLHALLEQKDALMAHLMKRNESWFGVGKDWKTALGSW